MKRELSVVLLFVVLLLLLVGCNSFRVTGGLDNASAAQTTIDAPAGDSSDPEVTEETTAEELPLSTIVALVVIVVVLALSNERLVEALKKINWIQPGQAATWQSVFGALAIAALALAKYLGLEGQITQPVNNLVEVATAFSLLILAFGQAGAAKLIHEIWKKIGWVAEIKPAAPLKLPIAVDRG
jgi:hypothetical protein